MKNSQSKNPTSSSNDPRKQTIYMPIDVQNDMLVIGQYMTDNHIVGLQDSAGRFKKGLIIEELVKAYRDALIDIGEWEQIEQNLRRKGVLADESNVKRSGLPLHHSSRRKRRSPVRSKDAEAAATGDDANADAGVKAELDLLPLDW